MNFYPPYHLKFHVKMFAEIQCFQKPERVYLCILENHTVPNTKIYKENCIFINIAEHRANNKRLILNQIDHFNH